MECDNNWTLRFLGVSHGDPFEVRPVEMSLKMSREEYDFCRATLPWEVGEMMKPHTRGAAGRLHDLTPVQVCHDGKPVQRLMFRPDWVDYGSQNTHIELHDLQKALADGVVDIQREEITLKSIYQEIVNRANNRLIDEIKFTLVDEQVRTLYGQNYIHVGPGSGQGPSIREKQTEELLDADYAIDFDKISPEKALAKLNKKYRLKSWVNKEGVLVVGLPEANQVRHIAAPYDDRVWRYNEPSITHSREPIHSVIVEGAWVDEPGLDGDVIGWFDKGGTNDVIAQGIAKRNDIDHGTTFTVSSTKAKKSALKETARLALEEKMKEQNSGTVEIDPALSGTEVSEVLDLTVGDLLHLVPDDQWYDNPTATSGEVGDEPSNTDKACGGFINNEAYLVTEVEHSTNKSGDWQVFADVALYPDVPIATGFSYFEPENGEWITEEDLFDNDWLETDGPTISADRFDWSGMADEVGDFFFGEDDDN